jgi:hypothetical protein
LLARIENKDVCTVDKVMTAAVGNPFVPTCKFSAKTASTPRQMLRKKAPRARSAKGALIEVYARRIGGGICRSN